MLDVFILCGLGLAAGLSSTLLGVGGGVFLVPLVILTLKISALKAVTLVLGARIFISAFSTWEFHRHGQVDWGLVKKILLPLGLGAVVGISGIIFLDNKAVLRFFGLGLAGLGTYLLLQTHMIRSVLKVVFGERIKALHWIQSGFLLSKNPRRRSSLKLWVFGSGCILGFSGMGMGLVLTPVLLVQKSISGRLVVPTVNAIMMVAVGLSFLILGGYGLSKGIFEWVHLGSVAALVVGSLPGVYLGRKFHDRFPESGRIWALAILLFCLSGTLEFL